ncbi:MAG: MaoC family dehydratase N-terminal domain-containing protein [Chloroflexi bacterium]|nr:MaoC family dehydratase N-terminal domain-containing protein [Chloroflexota bacterium]
MQESEILARARAAVGAESPPYAFAVEEGALRRFLDATGAPGHGRAGVESAPSEDGGAIAPPTFFCPDALAMAGQTIGLAFPTTPYEHAIDGGSEWELFEPVRVGDRLTMTAKIADVTEKRGSAGTGHMLLTTIEVVCHNQRGALVGIVRGTLINYEGGGA